MKPVRLMLVAHAPLATALRSTALHVFPEAAEDVEAIDITPGMGLDDAASAVRSCRWRHQQAGTDTLALVDVGGATPANACVAVLGGDAEADVLQGVNVPMLWRALAYRARGLREASDKAREGAFSGIGRLGRSD